MGRLITVHPTGIEPLSGRLLYADQSLLDFDMLQTGHGMREVLPPTIRALRASLAARPVMPVVNGEVCYEALLGKIPAEIPRLMFWTSMLSGAAGHTYGANGIWQLNRRDQPYGKSPHGGTYGPIPWDEAMRLPGSQSAWPGQEVPRAVSLASLRAPSGMGLVVDADEAPAPGGATGSGFPKAIPGTTLRKSRGSSARPSPCPRVGAITRATSS